MACFERLEPSNSDDGEHIQAAFHSHAPICIYRQKKQCRDCKKTERSEREARLALHLCKSLKNAALANSVITYGGGGFGCCYLTSPPGTLTPLVCANCIMSSLALEGVSNERRD